jgi:protein ImuB
MSALENEESKRALGLRYTPVEEYLPPLVERARAVPAPVAHLLFGRGAVHGLALYPDHRPELAWRRVEPGEWEPREFIQPGPRPLWLLEAPRRLRDGEFTLLAGPERIEAGWWDGDEAKRDYFIAQWEASMAWVYREAGEWFVHGLFA